MSLQYIRDAYNVPAHEGRRVVVFSGQKGTIIGANGFRLLIKVDGENYSKLFHPTWNIDYLDRKDHG